LTDIYNQDSGYNYYPNDPISGISPSEVWDIITTSETWAQCKPKIMALADSNNTTGEFQTWIADFQYWFNTFGGI
jgi:hypothetical protein